MLLLAACCPAERFLRTELFAENVLARFFTREQLATLSQHSTSPAERAEAQILLLLWDKITIALQQDDILKYKDRLLRSLQDAASEWHRQKSMPFNTQYWEFTLQ